MLQIYKEKFNNADISIMFLGDIYTTRVLNTEEFVKKLIKLADNNNSCD